MDAVRWVILVLLFAGLLAAWVWSKRQVRLAGATARPAAGSFRITQKRWLDQKTGLCCVEIEGQSFLLAYTVGGGVSWQPVAKKPADEPSAVESPAHDASTDPAVRFEKILAEAGLR